MANEVLTRKFKFYTAGCGHKYRAPEIEVTLKKKDNVINYETMEVENNAWMFTASGHYNGCWGQCLDEILNAVPYIVKAEGKESGKLVCLIVELWRKYHLNDMKAGTKKQMECLEDFVYNRNLKDSYYEQECSFLDEHNLLFDSEAEYRFGTKWLYMPIPEDTVNKIINIIDPTYFEAE